MLWLPQKGAWSTITNYGIVGATLPGTGVVSSATTLLDGAVVELISAASNTRDSWGIMVMVSHTGAAATLAEAKLTILIGGATDDVLIPDLIVGSVGVAQGWRSYFFPVHVPAGVRLAAFICSVRVSITCRCLVTLYGGGTPPWRVGRKVSVLGAEINGARGKAVTPGASGAAATVTEMVASSAADYFALIPAVQTVDTTMANTSYLNMGIGIGAATEQRLPMSWWNVKNTNEDEAGPMPPFPCFADVPAGSRISLLASEGAALDAAYDGHIYACS